MSEELQQKFLDKLWEVANKLRGNQGPGGQTCWPWQGDWGLSKRVGIVRVNFPQVVAEFPDMKGLSYRNLKYIRQWYQFYNEQLTIWQQAVSKLDEVNVQ